MASLQELRDYIDANTKKGVCLAFSGGVDSAVLLKLVCDTGNPVHAVTFATQLHPQTEISAAKVLAAQLGAVHTVIEVDEFSDPSILQNPPDRCYRCKRLLFRRLKAYAKEHDLQVLMDGTNADDLKEYRPGLKALKELRVMSPLADLSVDKQTIRSFAKQLGLSVASKPSAPCLATRLPYGDTIHRGQLERIAKGEAYLKGMGFPIVRLRLHGDIARLEVPLAQMPELLKKSPVLIDYLHTLGFCYITMDLEGFRSGSMDQFLSEAQK